MKEMIDYILKTLQKFDIEKETVDSIKKELENKQQKGQKISVSEYLHRYISPLLPKFYPPHTDDKSELKFKDIFSLTLKGDLPIEDFDKIIQQLSPENRINYVTTSYPLGHPLQIAAKFGNLVALKKLEEIYQAHLSEYEHRKKYLYQQFKPALIEAGKQKQVKCIQYLLEMCKRFSSLLEADSTSDSLWKRKLDYDDGSLFVSDGDAPLQYLFADVYVEFIVSGHKNVIETFYQFLSKHSNTEKELDEFIGSTKICFSRMPLIEKKQISSDFFSQTIDNFKSRVLLKDFEELQEEKEEFNNENLVNDLDNNNNNMSDNQDVTPYDQISTLLDLINDKIKSNPGSNEIAAAIAKVLENFDKVIADTERKTTEPYKNFEESFDGLLALYDSPLIRDLLAKIYSCAAQQTKLYLDEIRDNIKNEFIKINLSRRLENIKVLVDNISFNADLFIRDDFDLSKRYKLNELANLFLQMKLTIQQCGTFLVPLIGSLENFSSSVQKNGLKPLNDFTECLMYIQSISPLADDFHCKNMPNDINRNLSDIFDPIKCANGEMPLELIKFNNDLKKISEIFKKFDSLNKREPVKYKDIFSLFNQHFLNSEHSQFLSRFIQNISSYIQYDSLRHIVPDELKRKGMLDDNDSRQRLHDALTDLANNISGLIINEQLGDYFDPIKDALITADAYIKAKTKPNTDADVIKQVNQDFINALEKCHTQFYQAPGKLPHMASIFLGILLGAAIGVALTAIVLASVTFPFSLAFTVPFIALYITHQASCMMIGGALGATVFSPLLSKGIYAAYQAGTHKFGWSQPIDYKVTSEFKTSLNNAIQEVVAPKKVM